MRRLLKRLPHRRRDDTSEKRQSSQPDPIKAASSRTSTVFYDADDNDSTDPTINAGDDSTDPTFTIGNGRQKTAPDGRNNKRHSQLSKDDTDNKRHSQQIKEDVNHNQNSSLGEPKKRESALVSYDQPVDASTVHRSDTDKSITQASDHGLRLGPQDTSLYDDLSYLTLGGDSRDAVDPSRKRYSEDVADRNSMVNEKGRLSENTAGRRGSILRTPAQVDEFSEDIADRNLDSPSQSSTSNTELYPLETQHEMNRRIVTSPFSSDEFYDPRFEQGSASSNPSSIPLIR